MRRAILAGVPWVALSVPLPCQGQAPPVVTPAPGCVGPGTHLLLEDKGTPIPVALAPANSRLRPLPINLPTALKLGNAQALDIAAAAASVRLAEALLNRAQVLWIPSLTFGGDYFHHNGDIQNSAGQVVDSNYQSMMFGAGSGLGTSGAIISSNDAIFAPLAARQIVRARQADLQAANNDSLVSVTDAYFNVQQARGELAGAVDATQRMQELVRRTERLAPGLVPPVEAVRAAAELARRQQAELSARERWRLASADLLRVLRLDPGAQVEPVEPPHLRVELLSPDTPLDDLIAVASRTRPELASRQAQIQATRDQVLQERLRPLMPYLLVRGDSTSPAGELAGGVYAAGNGGTINSYGGRLDIDVQLLWQLSNLGFGNRALVRQRRAENDQAMIELLRVQDLVAAEVSQAQAQAESAAARVTIAERGLKLAVESAQKNLAGVGETQRVGDLVTLVIRPQEAVASVQALAEAYLDYYGAVADANRAQFRLYRALGNPAQFLLSDDSNCKTPQQQPPVGTATPRR